MRVRILRSYINDLADQNAVLVKTVEDLEADADGRVARLEAKLQKSSGVIKVQQSRMIVFVLILFYFINLTLIFTLRFILYFSLSFFCV